MVVPLVLCVLDAGTSGRHAPVVARTNQPRWLVLLLNSFIFRSRQERCNRGVSATRRTFFPSIDEAAARTVVHSGWCVGARVVVRLKPGGAPLENGTSNKLIFCVRITDDSSPTKTDRLTDVLHFSSPVNIGASKVLHPPHSLGRRAAVVVPFQSHTGGSSPSNARSGGASNCTARSLDPKQYGLLPLVWYGMAATSRGS